MDDMPVQLLITTTFSVLLVTIGLTPRWTKMEAKRLYKQYSRKISFSVKHQETDANKIL